MHPHKKKNQNPSPTKTDPKTRVMLRKGIRTKQIDLRRLFDALKNVRNARSSPLTEVAPPTSETRGSIRKWDSIEAMEAADIIEDNEPNIRVFQQTIEPPALLRQSIESLKASNTPILDAATGLDKGVSTAQGLSDIDLHRLRKLTNTLNFFSHSPISVSKEVFHWLGQFKSNPRVLRLLTPHAWELLWALETSTIPSSRSKLIGDMMVAADVPMTEAQEIAYIGGLFWNNGKEEAFRRWKEGTKSDRASPAYWNIGIRMISLDRQPQMAEHWMDMMLRRLGRTEPKTWIPIILSWNHIYKPGRAWFAYQKMRHWVKREKETITLSQYDSICMSFLDGGGPAYGLEVYKHMLLDTSSADRINTDFYSHLSEAVLAAQDSSDTPKDLINLSMDAIMKLPPKVVDKYFYGAWIKNLVRMDRSDLAYTLVRDVMNGRGFQPDSIHLNCIIQGFLEGGHISMVEDIVDEMVQKRQRLIKAKAALRSKGDPEFVDWSAAASATIPPTTALRPADQRVLPPGPTAPATIQTFSLLINYHTRRQVMDKVVALSTLMAAVEIPANSYIFNHFFYALLRIHDLPRLAYSFRILLKSKEAKPDLETWHVMWFAMWRRYTQRWRNYEEFLKPRELFRDMVQHLSRQTLQKLQGPKEIQRMRNIWRMVIKGFMLTGDLPGVFVAVHAGRTLWAIDTGWKVVAEITRGVFRNRVWDPKLTGTRPVVDEEMVERGVNEVAFLGRKFVARRRRIGKPWRRVRDPKGLLEGLTTLLREEMGESSRAAEAIETAKREMGVEWLVTD